MNCVVCVSIDDRVCEESRDAADKMAESRAAFARAAVARASAHVSRAEERVAILDRHGNGPYQQQLLVHLAGKTPN